MALHRSCPKLLMSLTFQAGLQGTHGAPAMVTGMAGTRISV